MVAKNDITGEVIASRNLSQQGKDNFDLIRKGCGCVFGTRCKCAEKIEWPETDERIDRIGRDGGDGLHYGQVTP
jgi:hypothetical protein